MHLHISIPHKNTAQHRVPLFMACFVFRLAYSGFACHAAIAVSIISCPLLCQTLLTKHHVAMHQALGI